MQKKVTFNEPQKLIQKGFRQKVNQTKKNIWKQALKFGRIWKFPSTLSLSL